MLLFTSSKPSLLIKVGAVNIETIHINQHIREIDKYIYTHTHIHTYICIYTCTHTEIPS